MEPIYVQQHGCLPSPACLSQSPAKSLRRRKDWAFLEQISGCLLGNMPTCKEVLRLSQKSNPGNWGTVNFCHKGSWTGTSVNPHTVKEATKKCRVEGIQTAQMNEILKKIKIKNKKNKIKNRERSKHNGTMIQSNIQLPSITLHPKTIVWLKHHFELGNWFR